MSLDLFLVAAAFICATLAALGVGGKVNLTAAALACYFLSLLI